MAIKKNILIFIPSLHGGGAEKVAVTLANNLNEKFNVSVINLEEGIKYDLKVPRTVLTTLDGKASKWKKLFYFPIQFVKFRKLIHSIEPDLIISFMERSSFISFLTTKKNVFSFHNYLTYHLYKEELPWGVKILRNFIYNIFIRYSHKRCKKIVIVSNAAKVDLVKNFRVPENKVEVIYNPYDVKGIEHLSKEQVEDVFCAGDYLINVGRLEKQKGQWHLIKIFKYLKDSFPELKLIILGEGSLKNYLVNLSEKLGMKTYVCGRDRLDYTYDVYFLGFKKNPFKYMRLAKLFLFTSLWEGLPNILVEAMACGVPIMSADCRSGPREILAPSTDVNLKTEKPEYAEFGILMPVLEEKYLDAYDKLTEKERIWLDTLKAILKNENKINHYRDKSRQRAYDFEIQKILGKWEEFILQSGR